MTPGVRGVDRMRILGVREDLLFWASVLALTLLVVGLAQLVSIPGWPIILPTAVVLLVAVAFALLLRRRSSIGLISEIGAIYVAFFVAYTIFPAATLLSLEFDVTSGWVWENLRKLFPDDSVIAAHLWRHVLFLVGFAGSYLFARRPAETAITSGTASAPVIGTRLIAGMMVTLVLSNLVLQALAAPVTEYVEYYTRYDHLSRPLRWFVAVIARLENGLMVLTLTLSLMSRGPLRLAGVCLFGVAFVFRIWMSMGSRIESLFLLLLTLVLYHNYVARVNIRRLLLVFLSVGVIYSFLEVYRAANFDAEVAGELIESSGFQSASEFGAVFFTGFHLYGERAAGTMPEAPWPMFFSDLISLVTPNSFVAFNPQHWYARNFFPDAEVPPQTNGPIADSAIWGGEWDLLVRAILNGLLFAWLANRFARHRSDWRVVTVYVFCYSTAVMSLKYSVLYHLNPLVKTVIPMILGLWGLARLIEVLRETPPTREVRA